jgi:hypothetical protein
MNDNFLLTIAFSIFGMLLIFGLGFIFPSVNPYVAIKWIVIVCAAVFAYSVLSYLFAMLKPSRFLKGFKKGSKK